MQLDQKQQIVAELQDRFTNAKVVVLTDYKGLDVAAVTDLRAKLREAGAEYRVVKNTLLVRAAEGTGVAVISDHFKGPSAVVMSDSDPVAPAKVLTEFAKANDKLEIKSAVLNGKAVDLAGIKSLANLPSREVLLAQVLGAVNAVPGAFVRTLAAVPGQLVNVLTAIKDQKEQAAA